MSETASPSNRVYRCGASAFFVMMRTLGIPITYSQCQDLIPPGSKGNSMLELKRAAEVSGVQVRGYSAGINELACVKLPVIVRIPSGQQVETGEEAVTRHHCIFLLPVDDEHIQVINPPTSCRTYERDEFALRYASFLDSRLSFLALSRKSFGDRDVIDSHLLDFVETVVATASAKSARDPGTISIVEEADVTQGYRAYHDCGVAWEGDVIRHAFPIQNMTSQGFRIVSTRKSCACSRVTLDESEIPPGGINHLTVEINTLGRQGILKGEVFIVLERSDGRRCVGMLRWTARIKPSIYVDLQKLEVRAPFDEDGFAPESIFQVLFRNRGRKMTQFTPYSYLRLVELQAERSPREDPDGLVYEIRAKAAGPSPMLSCLFDIRAKLKFDNTSDEIDEMDILLAHGRLLPNDNTFVCTPPRIFFRGTSPTEVAIRSEDGREFKIGEIALADPMNSDNQLGPGNSDLSWNVLSSDPASLVHRVELRMKGIVEEDTFGVILVGIKGHPDPLRIPYFRRPGQ